MPANLRLAGLKNAPMPGERTCEPLVPGQLVREAVQIVEKIHCSFLKSVEAALTELLQSPAAASFRESAQAVFPGAPKGGPDHGGSADRTIALDLSPLRGFGFLVFPPALLFGVLDILLATPQFVFPENGANSGNDARRPVTAIELDILREFFEVFARSLRDAWRPFYPAAFNPIPMPPDDSKPGETASGSDLALILRSTIDLAGVSADFHLVVPAFLARLVHLKSKAVIGQDAGSEPVRGGILSCLGGATLRMDAVLDGTSIRIRDLLDLAPGQILTAGGSGGSSFDCIVNGSKLFAGNLIASGGRCAIHVDTLTGGAGGQPRGAPVPDR